MSELRWTSIAQCVGVMTYEGKRLALLVTEVDKHQWAVAAYAPSDDVHSFEDVFDDEERQVFIGSYASMTEAMNAAENYAKHWKNLYA